MKKELNDSIKFILNEYKRLKLKEYNKDITSETTMENKIFQLIIIN